MNKVIKYGLVEKKSAGLGVTFCSYHWDNRDDYRREALDYEDRAKERANQIESFKTGTQQLSYENLRGEYDRLLTERDLKTHKLRQLKIKTLAWQKEPDLHYNTYKTNGVNDVAGMGAWFLNDLIGCTDAKESESEWLQKRREARTRFNRLDREYEVLLQTHRANFQSIEKSIDDIRSELKVLDAGIISELQKQRDIMLAYETKKRAEELGADQEADDRKRNLLEEARLAKENKEKERKKLIIGLSIIAAFGIIALKKKKNKKK